MSFLEERPKTMSLQTMLTIAALLWTMVVAGLSYSYGAGGDKQTLQNLTDRMVKVESTWTMLNSMNMRLVSVEDKTDQLKSESSALAINGNQRDQQINDLRERATKVETTLESLLKGQQKAEQMLERVLENYPPKQRP